MIALSEAIALMLLAALPAFLNFASAGMFEEEKSLLLRAGAVLALPGVIVAGQTHGPWLRRHAIVLTLAAFTAALVVASVAGVTPRQAFLGAHLRRHGSINAVALFVIVIAMCASARSLEGRRRLLGAVLLGSIWPSLYLPLHPFGLDLFAWMAPSLGFLPGSTFGNQVMFGGYLAVVVPLTAVRVWQSRRPIWVVVLVLQLASLVLCGSRGAVVATGASTLAFALVVAWARLPRRAVVAAVGILFGVLVIAPSIWPASIGQRLDPSVGTARVRVVIWTSVISLMRDSGRRLWFGYGPDSLAGVFPHYYPPELGRLEGTDAVPDRAHNETLDTLVSAGAVGVALQWAFFAAVVLGALRVADLSLRAGLVAAAIGHVIEIQFGIATVGSRLIFAAVAATVIGASAPTGASAPVTNRKTPSRRIGGPASLPSGGQWAWPVVAATVAALSPTLAMLPSRVSAGATNGTEADLLAMLFRLSLATPFLYVVLFGTAWLWSRSLAASARPHVSWLPISGLAAGVAVVIPLSLVPSRADVASQAGIDLESRQSWKEAAIAYREASRLQPSDSVYLAGLGRALIQEAVPLAPPARDERLRTAADALERARVLTPSDLDNTRHLASVLRVQAWSAGTDEAARAAPLERADRLFVDATGWAPGLTSLWIDWAHVDLDRHQPDAALVKMTRIFEHDPTRIDAHVLRGDVLRMQQKWSEAVADYDYVIAREPFHEEALRNREAALARRP